VLGTETANRESKIWVPDSLLVSRK
jgi:hypothetical protein